MFRAPVRQSARTDEKGSIIGWRYFYEALDDDQATVITETIPGVAIVWRGDLVEVLVPSG